jgi:hypothetical protein
MMRHKQLSHRFVDDMPEVIEVGLLYVSMRYTLALHLCCCGCGREISTPFSPAQWKLWFDGDSVTLTPSVGSWNLPCQSHYFIERGRVIEAYSWSKKEARLGRERDRLARDDHYNKTPVDSVAASRAEVPRRPTWKEWFLGLFN